MADRRLVWAVIVVGALSFLGAVLVLVDAVGRRNGTDVAVQVVAMAIAGWLVGYGVVLLRRIGPRRRE